MKVKVINEPLFIDGKKNQVGAEVELAGAPLENLLRDGRVEIPEGVEQIPEGPLEVEVKEEKPAEVTPHTEDQKPA